MPEEPTLALAVEDMTCGHCARTITSAALGMSRATLHRKIKKLDLH